jgi:hypothetical protein
MSDVRRREFIALLGGAAGIWAARAAGRAPAAHRWLMNVGNGEWSVYRVTVAIVRNSRLVT